MSNQGWGGPPQAPPAKGGGSGSNFGPPGPPFEGPPGGYHGAAPGTPFGGGGGPGGAEPWGIWDSIAFAWDRIKGDPGTILGALIVGGLISSALNTAGSLIRNVDPNSEALLGAYFVLNLLNILVSSFMAGGMMSLSLKVARGERYDFGEIFRGAPFFLSILGANILIGLGVLFGLFLLIVPGVILGLGWMMTVPVIVDRRLGTFDAMKESWHLMEGQKLAVFLWVLLAVLLVFAGLAACCVGVLFVGPVLQISYAYVYLKISGQRTADLSAVG